MVPCNVQEATTITQSAPFRKIRARVASPVVKYATIALALGRWRSSTAEQRFCKPQVGGSIPLASSTLSLLDPGYPLLLNATGGTITSVGIRNTSSELCVDT